MLTKQKVDDYKNRMEAASFSAWQIIRSEGKYKKGWLEYRNGMGLGKSRNTRINKEEKEVALKAAASLHERIIQAHNGRA